VKAEVGSASPDCQRRVERDECEAGSKRKSVSGKRRGKTAGNDDEPQKMSPHVLQEGRGSVEQVSNEEASEGNNRVTSLAWWGKGREGKMRAGRDENGKGEKGRLTGSDGDG
jgi:hypothetical protein